MRNPATGKARGASEVVGLAGIDTSEGTAFAPNSQLTAAVYDGLDHLGDVAPTGDRWLAVTASGVVLGAFSTRRDAARAVVEAGR
jgi:hypothetical protein